MQKKILFCFKQISTYDICFYIHFSRAFQKYNFRSVDLVTKPVPYLATLCIEKKIILERNPLNFYSLKVTKFRSDSVKNESVRTKKIQGGRQTQNAPPPRLFKVINSTLIFSSLIDSKKKFSINKIQLCPKL